MNRLAQCAKLAVLGLAVLLSGCAGFENGARPLLRIRDGVIVSPASTDHVLSPIRAEIESQCLNVSTLSSESDLKAIRNRLVSAYMFAVDLGYNEYERNLLNSVRENDIGAAVASLGLSTIGSVVGDQSVARALSTTNSIVTGTHTAIGRDYLLNQTLTVLQTQMRANRATQRALILRLRNEEYSTWDSCMALSEVLAYEQAGTLNGAIAAVSASAATANRNAQLQAQSAIRSVEYATGRTAAALEAYLDSTDLKFTARKALALQAMNNLGLGPQGNQTADERLDEIVADQPFEQERRQLIEAIRDLEITNQNDPAAIAALNAALAQ